MFVHKMWNDGELSKMVKGGIPFPMLSDAGGRVGKVYGIYDENAGVETRGRFIIDPDGVIQAMEVLTPSVGRNVAELIRPSLEKGIHVLCDRFVDATVAYQGYGRGLDLDWIERLNEFACNGMKPDCTLLLDIPAEEFVIRTQKNNKRYDRIESLGRDFQAKIRAGYLTIARQEPNRVALVDSTRTEDDVAADILNRVSLLLGLTPGVCSRTLTIK